MPRSSRPRSIRIRRAAAVAAVLVACATGLTARQPGPASPAPPAGEWRYIGGDVRAHALLAARPDHRRQLRDARGRVDVARRQLRPLGRSAVPRSTPLYVDGLLYTVAGQRRTVAAIDPGTGETLWTYREPPTTRWERGMRNNYGKGVAYGEVDGRQGDLLHLAGVLPARARCQDRPAPRELGRARADARVPAPAASSTCCRTW